MRRISPDTKLIIRDFLWIIPLVIYESLGTIYYFLPPLFGFFTAVLVANKRTRYLPLILVYLLFYEADHRYLMFGSWIFLFLFFRFIVPLMEDYIISRGVVLFLTVLISYVGLYCFVSLIYFAFGVEALSFSWLFVYYVFIETILALVFL
jgi:hypothetical protein